jgi:RNA polymerase sigma-70 factor (ECF subfamily)
MRAGIGICASRSSGFHSGAAWYKMAWASCHSIIMFRTVPANTPAGYQELHRLSDDDVMARLKEGCDDALAVLFERYQRLVFSIALKILRDEGEAEDVTQVVFLDIFKAAAQFDPARGTTKGWLLQYAYHRAISRKRYLNVRHFYAGQPDAVPSEARPDESAFSAASHELRDLLKKGFESLGEPQRRVIRQVTFEGLSMREIADRTGESLVNVRHHYYRGLRKLRTFVERQNAPVDKAVGDV